MQVRVTVPPRLEFRLKEPCPSPRLLAQVRPHICLRATTPTRHLFLYIGPILIICALPRTRLLDYIGCRSDPLRLRVLINILLIYFCCSS